MWKNWKHEVNLNDIVINCMNSDKLKDCTLFKGFITPDNKEKPFKREAFFIQLMQECGNFEVIFPESELFITRIHAWTINRIFYWQRIYNVLCKDYEPLENYNRTDIENVHNAKDEEHKINTDTNTDSESQVAGYNSGKLVDSDAMQTSGEMEENGTNNSIENTERNLHAYGNIGVTTSQQMLEQEVEVAQISMQEIIIDEFKDTFCLAIY